MAKRRDAITRANRRSARNYFNADGVTPTRGQLQQTERAFGGTISNRSGINRFRGRRGVRARARYERIMARQASSGVRSGASAYQATGRQYLRETGQQPEGGTITNS